MIEYQIEEDSNAIDEIQNVELLTEEEYLGLYI